MENFLRKLIPFFYDEKCLGSYQECEGSEIFFLFSCQEFSLQQFHGRFWQEAWYSWIRDKDFITHSRARGINFIIPPSALGMTWIGPPCIHNWFVSQLWNLEFRKSESFIMDSKRICLNFVMERALNLIILDSKQTCPLFPWDTLTVFPSYSL